jgi:Mrp family chromosome partitioning ATPase
MGRLLDALKRLEPEMNAAKADAPVALREQPLETIESTAQTAVAEPPCDWHDDAIETPELEQEVCAESHVENEADSIAEEEPAAREPFRVVSEQLDGLDQLLDEELPPVENAATETLEEVTASMPADLTDSQEIERPSIFFGDPALENSSVDELNEETEQFFEQFERNNAPASRTEEPAEAMHDRGVFVSIAKNVLAQLPGTGSNALFFTSPTDGEGKTELILPLAEAIIEQTGWKTILVDANFQKPDLTRDWHFSSRKGLFDVLAGEADWWDAVQETGLPKLSILLNNGLPANAIVAQPLAFSELLENLRREYRLVLIDSASLAHVESIPMVAYCEGVYLVVRLGCSNRRTLRESTQVLHQAGGNLLGCIAVGNES